MIDAIERLAKVQAATAFLRFLSDGAPPSTWLALRAYHWQSQEARNEFFNVTQVQDAANWCIERDQAGDEVYVRCTLLKGRPERGRGTKEATAGSCVLWLDYDVSEEENRDLVYQQLLAYEPPPSWINSSGRGLHAYWRLQQYTTDIDAIEACNRQLAKDLQADKCWACTAILRVPGTTNRKRGGQEPVKQLPAADGATYALASFRQAPLLYEHPQADYQAEPLPNDFLSRLPEGLANRILSGHGGPTKDGERIDRSENDWFIANSLLEMGYSQGQVLTVLTHPAWFSGSKTRENGSYQYAYYTVGRSAAYLEARRPTEGTPYRLLKPVVDDILFYKDKNGVRRKRAMADLKDGEFIDPCYQELKKHSVQFYHTGGRGILVTPDGQVLPTDEQEFFDWLYQASEYTQERLEGRLLARGLAACARLYGVEADLSSWVTCDQRGLYVLLDSRGRRVLRVSPDGGKPEEVANGTDQKLLTRSTFKSKPLHYQPETDVSRLSDLYELIGRFIASDPATVEMLQCFLLALPLQHAFSIQTAPLLHITGRSGGGKSQTLKMITAFLHGEPVLINSTPAAVNRFAYREILLPFDDYERLSLDMQNVLLTGTTGNTRIKSGQDVSDTVTHTLQVPFAMTSIAPLPDLAIRRRALVVTVDKNEFPVPDYSDFQVQYIIEARDRLWSAYINWLASGALSSILHAWFRDLTKRVEALLEDTFRGLAPWVALMYLVGAHAVQYLPVCQEPLEVTVQRWIDALGMNEREEVEERSDLLGAVETLFNIVRSGPQSESLRRILTGESGKEQLHLVSALLHDAKFTLRLTPPEKLPVHGKWIGLEGTTTDWLHTINQQVGRIAKNAHAMGWMFSRLLGVKRLDCAKDTHESRWIEKAGFRFIRLEGIGAGRYQNGWRVLTQLD